MLTDEQYVKGEGNFCPVCQSDDVSSTGPVEVQGGGASQPVECRDCGAEWYDLYVLVGFSDPE